MANTKPLASQIRTIASAVGAIFRTQQQKNDECVSVKDFGAVGDGVADDTAAIQAARDFIAVSKARLEFPAGTYKYSVSPNWAIPDAEVIALGKVVLQYTGVGNALIFDAGPLAGDLVYNMQFGVGNRFHLNAPGTAQNAIYVRSVHHSKIGVNVHGAGAAAAALRVEFAVVTEFDIVASANEGGWYLGAKPAIGCYLTERLAGETCSYCYFPNPVIEGVDIGVHLVKTLGNLFVGGTSEGCTSYGVLAEVGALNDRFIGTDFEVNTAADIFCQGLGVEFINCDSYSLAAFGVNARRCKFVGGNYQTVLIDGGALACSALDLVYNRFTSTGTFTDAGTLTELSNVRNASGALLLTATLAFDPVSIPAAGAITQGVTVAGAVLGDFALCAFSISTAGAVFTAAVVAANSVSVTIQNVSGAPLDLGAGTLSVRCFRKV